MQKVKIALAKFLVIFFVSLIFFFFVLTSTGSLDSSLVFLIFFLIIFYSLLDFSSYLILIGGWIKRGLVMHGFKPI
jgi:hypothetical protein